MSKITSKLQITIPKKVAEKYNLKPGGEIEWQAAGEAIRILPSSRSVEIDVEERLALFDAASKRQQKRQSNYSKQIEDQDRGWTREDLYQRGSSD
jgi:AbrB family looped-hinge helix DNA binding protein